jgi:hypothetical protein
MFRLHAGRVIAAAVLLVAGTARAGAPIVTPDKSIYVDDRNKPLLAPEGVACTDAGDLFVADTGNGRILRYTYKKGVLGGGSDLTGSPIKYPVRLAIDSKGGLWVLDQKLKRLGRFDASAAYSPVNIVDPVKNTPVFIGAFKLDRADAIYVVDVETRGIVVADTTGRVQRRLPPPGPGVVFTDIAVDVMGTIYAIDAIAARLYSAKADEQALTPMGPSLKEFMSFPVYLTHRGGTIEIVDQHGGGLVLVGNDGVFHGRQLTLGWSEGMVYYPSQVCASSSGDLFVADRGNNRVQVFTVAQ